MDARNTHGVSKGFTLIELLVVISIIALLLSILMPALNIVKQKARRILCMANQRNIALAWEAYTTENNGEIVNGYCDQDYMQSAGGQGCWVEPPQDKNGTYFGAETDNVPLEYRLNGLKKGLLYPYLETTDVFHCSGDLRFKKGVRAGSSLAKRIYRSYSIPDGIHANAEEDTKTYKVPKLVTRSAIKMSEIRHASNKYILIEEAYDSGPSPTINYNDASWDLGIDEVVFWDPLGIYHNDSCTIAFADAHVESYKFRDPLTIEYFANRKAYLDQYGSPPGGDNEDLRYFLKNWPGLPR